jgi:hypothetical protein
MEICTNTALYFPWRCGAGLKYGYGYGLQFKVAQIPGMAFKGLFVE